MSLVSVATGGENCLSGIRCVNFLLTAILILQLLLCWSFRALVSVLPGEAFLAPNLMDFALLSFVISR